MLEIQHLQKTYLGAEGPALADFDLTIADGEFVTLIGPSGCGKTTALRIVAGLLEPSGGDVRFNGVSGFAPSREKAMVFQQFNLFPWRTALTNVAYGLEMQGMGKKERMAIAAEYLELVGLSDRAHHYPSQLSGGQNQRVGLARALAIQPKLMLMDEPFGALDHQTRELMQELLQGIWEAERKTILFVTHDIDEAIFMGTRVVVMSARPGRIKCDLPVAIGHPRHYSVKTTPLFTQLKSRLTEEIRIEVQRAARLG